MLDFLKLSEKLITPSLRSPRGWGVWVGGCGRGERWILHFTILEQQGVWKGAGGGPDRMPHSAQTVAAVAQTVCPVAQTVCPIWSHDSVEFQ